MDTDGGGWTRFYNRADGSADFAYDPTTYYFTGIGSPSDTEWLLPLHRVNQLTAGGGMQLLV